MKLARPRRIFISSQRRRASVPFLRVLLGGVLSMGTVSAAAHFAAGLDFSRAALPQAGAATTNSLHLAAANAAVIDGETLRLAGQVIRLEGVHAPLRGEADGRDAAASAGRLADLVRGQMVACELHGGDAGGQPLARCSAGGLELNRALVLAGR